MADTTFEFYRLLVEEVRDARRARRELSNIFLTLNIAGVGGLGFIARDSGGLDPALFGWCAAALVLTSLIWATSNRYYTKVLKAKYAIIRGFEDRLGEHPLRDEYNAMGGTKAMRAFTLERIMPILFILGYAVFFAVQSGDWLEPLWAWLEGLAGPILQRIGTTR